MELAFPKLIAPDSSLALRVGERTLTWNQLSRACAGHIDALRHAGVESGERIGVWTEPSLETLVAILAQTAAGYVSIPLNPKLGSRELEHILGVSAPRLTVSSEPNERTSLPTHVFRADPVSAAPPLDRRPVMDVPALVLFTSGTTGAPKGAVITLRNIVSNLDALAKAWNWSAEDTVVHALPVFHVHGLVLGLMGAIRRGGALHWIPRFEVDALASALREHEQPIVFGVPTMYHRLALAAESERAVGEALRCARVLISGSAALPVREHRRIEALSGHRVIERYGLTETLINCSTRCDGDRSPGYVGLPLDGVELMLVDDRHEPIDASDDKTIGEIAVRGPNVFAGYLDNPEATAAMRDSEGWVYTGDLACRRADGAIRIVGRRATDLIKSGGFKIGAGEIEAALLEHPSVREAAVIGVPDPDLGERIVAYIVLAPESAAGTGENADTPAGHVDESDAETARRLTESGSASASDADLASFVANLLSSHKRPREVIRVDSLPRNAMGKVQKKALRQLHQDGAPD